MSVEVEEGLRALADQWRARARHFMEEAEQTRSPADMVRLTAMASTLEWAASDLTARSLPLRKRALLHESGSSTE
jgi:hypothetical protein